MENKIKDIAAAGLLVAAGILLPIAFHTYKLGGPVFLPMHIPVLLGGFMLSKNLAALIGISTPFLSFVLTSMPSPPAVFAMMAELATYGFVSSFFYRHRKWGIYPALAGTMLSGRIASIVANWLIIACILEKPLSLAKVMTSLFITGLPGILIQLILIPLIVKLVESRTPLQGQASAAGGERR
ncbi:ECF transporter S component [Thermosediminibacter litoriperuensis]|uniref:Niacin transporter n=1 Tax=Thermosediminibacter litoriperuensis TaxID=291989 RepID=A0A5S5AZY9_9FIRM|nr:ECF transporter S component [Thermosediminibacter litoriperuensis]TYP58536.1 niacin transporter [Thermosediminibacter litoriperuensis]